MDNASNCNKLAELLSDYIPTFPGMDARLRCLAHIINLIAKVTIFLFLLNNYLTHLFRSLFLSFSKSPK